MENTCSEAAEEGCTSKALAPTQFKKQTSHFLCGEESLGMSMSSKNSQHHYGAPTQFISMNDEKGMPVGGAVICLVVATKLVVVTVSMSQLDYEVNFM